MTLAVVCSFWIFCHAPAAPASSASGCDPPASSERRAIARPRARSGGRRRVIVGMDRHTIAAMKWLLRPLGIATMATAAVSAAAFTQQPAPPAPNPDLHYQLGTGLAAARRRPEGRGPRTVHAAERGVSGHAAHLLGLRARAVRPAVAGEPDDLQRRPGVQEHGRRPARAERAGQPDLPARDPGDDRGVHQSRAAGPISPSRRRRTGAIATPTGRPNTTRSTTSTRGSSSTS